MAERTESKRDSDLRFEREALPWMDDVYRFARSMSRDEAATVLGVPIGTVRSRLFRGRRLLQQQLLTYAKDAGIAVPEEGSDGM